MDEQDSHARKRPEPESLPLAVVTQLWTRLSAVYGQRFLAQYDGVELGVVKEDWRRRLAGLRGDQLTWALDNLETGKPPPDVLEFRRLAVSMPDDRRLAHHVLGAPTGPREVPKTLKPVVAALLQPKPEDAEPAHIVVARDFIARWSAPDARPTVTNQQWLAHWRKVVERYERNNQPADAEPHQPPENP